MPGHDSQKRVNRLIVGVTGRIGAGKTSVAKYLSTAHGFGYVRYSQVLSKWRAESPDSKNRLQDLGWEVMGGGMQTELNARLIAEIPPNSNCAVDGLRHPIDFDSLTKSFTPDFFLVYVNCLQETRWKRLRARYPHLEDFRQADSHPVEQQIEALRVCAFGLINNNKSLQDLFSKIETLLERMRQGGQP